MPEVTKEQQALIEHLSARAARFRAQARKNDGAAAFCFFTALVGSLAATVCAAFADLPRWAVVTITAIPGTALLANSVFAFDKKMRWHRTRKRKYDAFVMRIQYEGTSAAEISKELRDFEEKIDDEYPRFGYATGGDKDKNS